VELRRWVEVSWVFEVFGGYVGVVKMGLVEFRRWLVLVKARAMRGLGQQRGRWRRQPWWHEQPLALSPRPSSWMNPSLILHSDKPNNRS